MNLLFLINLLFLTNLIPFCSSGSSSPEISFESVKASAAGADVLDGFWTRGTEVANVKDEIDEWIDRLGIFKKHEEEKIMGNKIHITVVFQYQ